MKSLYMLSCRDRAETCTIEQNDTHIKTIFKQWTDVKRARREKQAVKACHSQL